MKTIVLAEAQLHKTLFLGKTNLGETLRVEARAGLELTYSTDEGMLYVTYKGETGMVPTSGIACMIPKESRVAPIAPKIVVSTKPFKAQVSTPQGDLMTPGEGKTGQGGK